jgi:hypothetical protein
MKSRSQAIPLRCFALSVPLAVAVALALVLVGAGTASAAEATGAPAARETVTVATSLITPFFGAYYLEVKVRASSSIAAILNASYLTLESDDWKNRASTVGAGGEYFFQGDAFRRWYVEAIAEIWLSSWRHQPSGQSASIGLGYAGIALVGYQFLFDRGPVVDLGVGVVGFHLSSAHVDVAGAPVSSAALTKVYPAAKVNVGWAF